METETAGRLKIKRKKEKKMFDDAGNKIIRSYCDG